MLRFFKYLAIAVFFLWVIGYISSLNLFAQEKPVEPIGCFASKAEMIKAFQQSHPELAAAKPVPAKAGFGTIRWTQAGQPPKEWQLDYETRKCTGQSKLRLYTYDPAEFFSTILPARDASQEAFRARAKPTKPK